MDASWKKELFHLLQLIDFKHAPVAQLDRAADFESVGRVFEPPQARQLTARHSRHTVPTGSPKPVLAIVPG